MLAEMAFQWDPRALWIVYALIAFSALGTVAGFTHRVLRNRRRRREWTQYAKGKGSQPRW